MPKTPSASSGRGGAAPKKILGIPEARLWPRPARTLSKHTSYGYDVIDFAEAIGQPLIPWQQWCVKHLLEINRDGTYRFRTGLVMVARQSGKSHLVRMITLWRMLFDEDCRLILGTAQDLAQASNQWKLTLAIVQQTPFLAKRLAYERHVNGQEAFGLRNGAEYMVRSANANAGRGFSVDGLICDELRTHRDSRAWSALNYTTMARPNPLTICVSNAGDDESVVLNRLREEALKGDNPTVGLFEWSAEDGCELDDINAWRQANPGLGHTVSLAALKTNYATDPPNVFRTEALCQKVDQLDGAIDLACWEDCADPIGNLEEHRGRIAACFDISLDGKHATLAVAAMLPDDRVRIEIAGAWDSTEAARFELPQLLDRIKPQVFGWFPTGPAAGMASTLRARRGSTELTGGQVTEACQEFADLVKARRIAHKDDPLLNAHVKGADKHISGDGYRFTRKKGDGHVDAAYAAAGAAKLALQLPPPRRARIRMIS
jgi:phage terminase large subunit-like protein